MFPTRQLYLGPTDQESICPKRSMSRPWYFRELLVEEFLRCEMFELKGATALSNRSTAHKCRLHLLPLRTTEGKRVERNLPKTASIGHTKQAARAAGVAVGDVFKRRVPRYWGWYHLLANHCICDWRSSPTIAAEELPNINHCTNGTPNLRALHGISAIPCIMPGPSGCTLHMFSLKSVFGEDRCRTFALAYPF